MEETRVMETDLAKVIDDAGKARQDNLGSQLS
ncbi:MAG: hypothetical protein KatS3mg087_0246 [Patescibacteria group bacterium]|nr:MAG: hypothetical protein KatS3mg087_0246 [Patescibacteria group bacterium]